ncbi:MAG: hypothetical protein JO270_11600, partial [Acidobacteriaceae bacterium]|nr:hypothetical protein [Acidobacteriaceae bacterium]
MTPFRLGCCLLSFAVCLGAGPSGHLRYAGGAGSEPGAAHAAAIAAALEGMSIDPAQTYRVRDLELTRGDIKIYLTEGVLSFATAVDGRCVAAIFTTHGVEGGDAEVLLLPNRSTERASLAAFAKT